jgi:hypothetical protein
MGNAPPSSLEAERPRFPILLSVVVVLDERTQDIRKVLAGAIASIETMVTDFEIIVVDIHPEDPTRRDAYQALTTLEGLPNLQVYELLQTVDYDTAAWAGVENSLGDYVFVFDPLNDDTSQLYEALTATSEGRDIVLLVNSASQQMKTSREIYKAVFLRVFHWLSGVDLATEASSCRVMSKRVVGYLLQFPRPARRYRGLPAVAGFSKSILHFTAASRVPARFHLLRDLRRAWHMMLGNSILPLRLASSLALMGAVLNILYSIYVLVITFSTRGVAKGWTTLSLQQSGMFFLISLVLFMLTEYLIQTIAIANQGPAYFVAAERTSAVLTRRQKLNVHSESAGRKDGPA